MIFTNLKRRVLSLAALFVGIACCYFSVNAAMPPECLFFRQEPQTPVYRACFQGGSGDSVFTQSEAILRRAFDGAAALGMTPELLRELQGHITRLLRGDVLHQHAAKITMAVCPERAEKPPVEQQLTIVPSSNPVEVTGVAPAVVLYNILAAVMHVVVDYAGSHGAQVKPYFAAHAANFVQAVRAGAVAAGFTALNDAYWHAVVTKLQADCRGAVARALPDTLVVGGMRVSRASAQAGGDAVAAQWVGHTNKRIITLRTQLVYWVAFLLAMYLFMYESHYDAAYTNQHDISFLGKVVISKAVAGTTAAISRCLER